jgi:hypothetical protein
VALPSLTLSPTADPSLSSRICCDRRAVDAVLRREQRFARQRRLGQQFAIERIGFVDGLQLDQRLVGLVFQPRHGAHVGGNRDIAERVEKGAFVVGGGTVDQFDAEIAAEDHLAFLVDAVGNRFGDRIDAADRGGAERDTGEKDVETRQTAAQFAQRETEGKRHQA